MPTSSIRGIHYSWYLGSKTPTTTAGSTIRDVATLVNNSFENTCVNALAQHN